ncbi:MAG: PLP-dependent aminotransferase family protein [Brevundimonas sp.]
MALHDTVAAALRQAIASGAYGEGARLPTHRDLARTHGVAIGTITRAIDQLTQEGLVRGEVGRGTFVLPRSATPSTSVIDLTINFPPPLIGDAAFQAAAARAARAALDIPSAGYADLRGTSAQREVLARWLQPRVPGVHADELMTCVGGQHGIHLAFAALKPASAGIASEAATFSGAIAAAADLGLPFHAVAHDDEGMLPDALAKVLKSTGCRAVYTVPVCQNPLGFETGEARRRDILEVCRRHDAWIVEDDVYGLYESKAAATYRALDPARTWYLTSTSKALSPLMRVGVLLPPADAYGATAARLRAEVWGAAPIAIEFACALIEMGVAEQVARDLKAEARERVRLAADMLQLTPPMPDGAAHVWVAMPAAEAERLVRRAAEAGVRLTPPDATAVDDVVAGVRLCVMAPGRRADLVRALRVVAELRHAAHEPIV